MFVPMCSAPYRASPRRRGEPLDNTAPSDQLPPFHLAFRPPLPPIFHHLLRAAHRHESRSLTAIPVWTPARHFGRQDQVRQVFFLNNARHLLQCLLPMGSAPYEASPRRRGEPLDNTAPSDQLPLFHLAFRPPLPPIFHHLTTSFDRSCV